MSRATSRINKDLQDLGLVRTLAVAAAATAFGLDPAVLSDQVQILAHMWVDDLAIPVLITASSLFAYGGQVMAVVCNFFSRVLG